MSIASIPTPSSQPSPVTLPVAIPAFKKPGAYKKRTFIDTEDSSEEDVNMDIDSNDSSGSSVDSDHIPAKRLRSSTIVTRRSKPASGGTTADPSHHGSPSSSIHGPSISLDKPIVAVDPEAEPGTGTGTEPETGTEPGTETEPETGLETEPESENHGHTNIPPPNLRTIPTEYTVTDAGITTNKPGSTSGTSDNAARVDACRTRKPINAPAVPSKLPPSPSISHPASELVIPEFLVGKNDIYGYLSRIEETRFRDLLKTYITFELANNTCIRSGLPTSYRPNVIGWWTGHARPDRLPPYDSLGSLTKSILAWWTFIQPPWRQIKLGDTSRIEGDWERLYRPGINGLLNVVILAYWWVKILKERGSTVDETYSWFVSDVTWVLSQLTSAARNNIY